jgi:hypothetical protein
MAIMIVDFDIIEQPLIIYSAFVRYWRKRIGVQWNSMSAVYGFQKSTCWMFCAAFSLNSGL